MEIERISLFTVMKRTDPPHLFPVFSILPPPTHPLPKPHRLGSLYGLGPHKSPVNGLGKRAGVGADNGTDRCLFTFSVLKAGVSRGRPAPGAEVEKDTGLPCLPLPYCSQCSESGLLTGSVLPGSRCCVPGHQSRGPGYASESRPVPWLRWPL